MCNNECECEECRYNNDRFCELAWIALDLDGSCTDMELKEN